MLFIRGVTGTAALSGLRRVFCVWEVRLGAGLVSTFAKFDKVPVLVYVFTLMHVKVTCVTD